MKIVQLIPGTGGTFYCQNCMRDAALVRALKHHGAEVTLVPLYLPLTVDADGLGQDMPVFFGGINVYLQQEFKPFRHTPRWLDRIFDSQFMLRQAAAREGSTSAAALGPMTLSMLQGRDGNQRKEVDRLIAWLKEHHEADLVHVSNSLLLGVAPEIKRVLNVPIVCSLQDEHMWLDAMPEPHRTSCWDAMSEQARHVDAFIAVSDWYADEMSQRMGIARERITVVPVGMELDDSTPAEELPDPPVIGYLSRISECLGFGILADAFLQLKEKPQFKHLRLRVTGGRTAEDVAFIDQVRATLRERGVESDVEFIDDFGREARHEFLRSLSVLSVPVQGGEAFGTFIVEALAFGVPVVQPAAGAFPEIIEKTGGGVVYDPNDEKGLVAALEQILSDPAHRQELGIRGRAAVLEDFSVERSSQGVLAVYQSLVDS